MGDPFTYVSQLANAGIAPDVRQLLSGHADEKSHAVYTHTKLETLRNELRWNELYYHLAPGIGR